MLNLTVIAQPYQPSDPKENTIWIKSDIGAQSVYITSIQPSIDNLIVGDVWINTGSGYNVDGLPNANDNMLVIKDNPYLQIIIGTVKQYIGDEDVWSRPDVQIYKNGEWHSEVLYIYSQGLWWEYGMFDNYAFIWTGGSGPFITEMIDLDNWSCFRIPDWTNISTGYARDYYQVSSNAIDATKYNTLSILLRHDGLSNTSYQASWEVGLFSKTETSFKFVKGYNDGGYDKFDPVEKDTFTFDISSLSGEYYPGISGGIKAARSYCYIYEIALIV